MTNRTKSEFTSSHCRVAAKTNFLMLLLFPARFAHARYSSRMIDRFLNWGNHGKPKSGKIKGRCQPPPVATTAFFLLITSGPPRFYLALLKAWSVLPGSLSHVGLVAGSADTTLLCADSLSCKSCHQLILSLNPETPHCVDKLRFDFSNLIWAATWKSPLFMPLDWKSLDLRWKIAHGVLYTAHRLLLFGLFDVPLACFCGHPAETLEHLFFHCPLAQNGLDWIQFFCFCPLHWSLTFLFATFFFCFKDDVLL